MIAMIQTVPVGNALRVWLQPPDGSVRTRLLRCEVSPPVGWDDPNAFVVFEGGDLSVLDFTGLIDGVEYHYRAFYRINGAWVPSEPREATPAASYAPVIVNPLKVLRDRFELGLRPYVTSGQIFNERGFIPVLMSSPLVENITFPLVTLHVQEDASDIRGIGEEIAPEHFDGEVWHSYEGTLARWNITLVVWSQNSDERIALRDAVKAVLIANLPVFDAAGLLNVAYTFTDLDDFENYSAPMHQAVGSLTCNAVAAVKSTASPISTVISTVQE